VIFSIDALHLPASVGDLGDRRLGIGLDRSCYTLQARVKEWRRVDGAFFGLLASLRPKLSQLLDDLLVAWAGVPGLFLNG